MKKKSALVIASTVLAIVVTMSAALALNLGILERTSSAQVADPAAASPPESLSAAPVAAATTVPATEPTATPTGLRLFPDDVEVVTVYVDDAPVAEVAPPTTAPTTAPASAPAAPTATSIPAPTAPPPTATPLPSVTPTSTPVTVGYPVYDVGGAGRVALVFDGSTIHFWGAYPNGGWQYRVERDGPDEVKVEFAMFDDDGEDIAEREFQAELEGGRIKVEVDD